MFKVRCIGQVPNKCGICGEKMPAPEIGDCDAVIDVYKSKYGVHYSLDRFGLDCLYRADLFAILPDDTADEVDAGEKEAIVNLEIA